MHLAASLISLRMPGHLVSTIDALTLLSVSQTSRGACQSQWLCSLFLRSKSPRCSHFLPAACLPLSWRWQLLFLTTAVYLKQRDLDCYRALHDVPGSRLVVACVWRHWVPFSWRFSHTDALHRCTCPQDQHVTVQHAMMYCRCSKDRLRPAEH